MEQEIERILGLSDEAILEEVRAEGGDPEQIATEIRALVEPILTPEEHPGWSVACVAFRLTLGGLKNQNMTIRDLRRLLLANRKTGLFLVGGPSELARYINGLEKL